MPTPPPDALPPLRLDYAARAEAQARTGGAWSLRHLRLCWGALGVAGVLITAAGALVAGAGAAVAALIGTLIVGLFFTVSAVVIARVGARNPGAVMWAALGSYVVKMLALYVVVAVVPQDGWLDVRWLAGAVGLGLLVWLAAHMRFVWTNKILYVASN